MKKTPKLDIGSISVIVVTFVLFVISLFLKGLGHEILLDAAVFLVSVKLIIMSFRNNQYIQDLNQRLDEMEDLIRNK